MYKFFKNLSYLLCLIIIFAGCRKKAFDDYYGRPETLQPPIYQVLQNRGNFTTLLALIDKSGYKQTLSAAGYWTFFAPNEAAFQKYFTDNNTTLEKVSPSTAFQIVTYCLVYNAFQTNHIADYQSATGWVPNAGFRRRTAYYDNFFKIFKPAALSAQPGDSVIVLSGNRNGSYLFGDNNNKYIPYFYTSFMSANGLSASDYNYFFPSSTYTGFNVVNASVLNKDILAENGVIHEIDRVILPLPNFEQKIAANNQYSAFRRLFEKQLISYQTNDNVTRRYNTTTGKTDNVFVRIYSGSLAVSLNNENFLKATDNDGQSDTYTLFTPNNTALYKYFNDVILEFYKNNPNDQLSNDAIDALIDKLSPTIINDFLNAHMWQTAVWPTKFNSTTNFLGEPARFDPATNVVEKQFCSNGIFYGTNQVQRANVFSSVYARAYLDPAYSLMTRLLDINLKLTITNPSFRFTVFMLSDATLNALGYGYDSNTSSFTLTANGTTTSGAGPRDQLLRILNLQVVSTPDNYLNDLSGSGIAETNAGEYIRWSNNTVFSAGNIEKSETVNVIGSRDYINGKVYYLGNNKAITYPTGSVASGIARNAGTAAVPGPYYDFYQYLLSSPLYTAATGDIIGLLPGTSYTFFIPTRAAIQQAIRDGFLPGTVVGTTVTPTYNPTTPDDRAKVARFIQFHILDGIAIAADAKKSPNGSFFKTLLINSSGDKLSVSVFNQPGNFYIQDNQSRKSNLVPANSNNLGTRALFHQIDNYLKYNF